MPEPRDYPGAPRWMKRSALVAGFATLFVVILLILMHAGIAPPHRKPPGDAGSQTTPSDVARYGAQR